MLRITGFIFLFVMHTACTTKVDGLYISDAFTPGNIQNGQMIAEGVVTSGEKFDRASSNQYSNLMRARIQDERRYAQVQTVEQVIQALGDHEYDVLMRGYASSGLGDETLNQLADQLPRIRFLALARIDSNQTEVKVEETAASETKDDKGNVQKHPRKLNKKHERRMTVTMHIYDLRQAQLAFTGQISKSQENSRSFEVTTVGTVLSVVSALQGQDDERLYPTPAAPDTAQVLNDIFKGFAQNFPKK